MSLGNEDAGWAAWMAWTIIKWSGIALMFVAAVLVGWLVVLVVLPAHAGKEATPGWRQSSTIIGFSAWHARGAAP
jgi:hypothetical protein